METIVAPELTGVGVDTCAGLGETTGAVTASGCTCTAGFTSSTGLAVGVDC